jgi:hypothetical protein
VRVDNEAKGCLDDIALTMQQQAGAKLVVVGNSSANEHPEAGAERALNARQYLVQEKGIDSSRIEVRAGSMPGRFVSNTLVPPGAHFDGSSSRTFDENSIVRHGQAYGVPGSRAPSGSHYQPRRGRSSHSKAPVQGPIANPSTPSAKPGAAPGSTTKPNPHAKPSPATPMPVQPTQGKRSIAKPSPATPMQATGSKTSPATPMPQPAKKS